MTAFFITPSPPDICSSTQTLFLARIFAHFLSHVCRDHEHLQQAWLLKLHELNAATEAAHQKALRVSVRRRLYWEVFALRRCFLAWRNYSHTKNTAADISKEFVFWHCVSSTTAHRRSGVVWKVDGSVMVFVSGKWCGWVGECPSASLPPHSAEGLHLGCGSLLKV